MGGRSLIEAYDDVLIAQEQEVAGGGTFTESVFQRLRLRTLPSSSFSLCDMDITPGYASLYHISIHRRVIKEQLCAISVKGQP